MRRTYYFKGTFARLSSSLCCYDYEYITLGAMAIKEYSAFPKGPASDSLVSYSGHSLAGGLPLSRESVGVFYSPSRLGNWQIKVPGIVVRKKDDVDSTLRHKKNPSALLSEKKKLKLLRILSSRLLNDSRILKLLSS